MKRVGVNMPAGTRSRLQGHPDWGLKDSVRAEAALSRLPGELRTGVSTMQMRRAHVTRPLCPAGGPAQRSPGNACSSSDSISFPASVTSGRWTRPSPEYGDSTTAPIAPRLCRWHDADDACTLHVRQPEKEAACTSSAECEATSAPDASYCDELTTPSEESICTV